MKRTKRGEWADLGPGIAAIAAFLAMFWLLPMPVWISAALSVGVYVGTKWLLPTPKEEVVRPLSANELLVQLRQLSAAIFEENLRHKLSALCAQTDELLRLLQTRPEAGDESLFVVREFLALARTGVERYLAAAQRSRIPARQSAEALNELLDDVSGRFASLQRKLVSENDANLASELKSLTQTLKELDQVYLNLGEKHE